MISVKEAIAFWSLICLTCFILSLYYLFRKKLSVGIVPRILTLLMIDYWLGAVIYVFDSWDKNNADVVVMLGIKVIAFGMIGAIIGVILASKDLSSYPIQNLVLKDNFVARLDMKWTVDIGFIIVLSVFSLVFSGFIPTTISSAVSGFYLVFILSILFRLKNTMSINTVFLLTFLCCSLIIAWHLILDGFLSFGLSKMLFVLLFVVYIFPIKKQQIVYITCFILFLSIFANQYFNVRDQLRSVVWSTDSTITDRLDTLYLVADNNLKSSYVDNIFYNLDLRFNQAAFLGTAVLRLESKEIDFLNGKTFFQILIALVPRVLWNDKPKISGSNELITYATGREFSNTSSFGFGINMENYLNFGLYGSIFMNVVYFFIATKIDIYARRALHAESLDIGKFVLLCVIGNSMVSSFDTYSTIFASVAGAYVFCTIILKIKVTNLRFSM